MSKHVESHVQAINSVKNPHHGRSLGLGRKTHAFLHTWPSGGALPCGEKAGGPWVGGWHGSGSAPSSSSACASLPSPPPSVLERLLSSSASPYACRVLLLESLEAAAATAAYSDSVDAAAAAKMLVMGGTSAGSSAASGGTSAPRKPPRMLLLLFASHGAPSALIYSVYILTTRKRKTGVPDDTMWARMCMCVCERERERRRLGVVECAPASVPTNRAHGAHSTTTTLHGRRMAHAATAQAEVRAAAQTHGAGGRRTGTRRFAAAWRGLFDGTSVKARRSTSRAQVRRVGRGGPG